MQDKKSLVIKFAERYSVDANKLLATLKATAFQQSKEEISNEQMMALLVVADQYKLNPFTREIYAFPDKHKGIVPVVGVDGWSRIINQDPNFNGMEYRYSETMVKPDGALVECHEWVDCIMHRKDRDNPTVVREYLDESYRPPFKNRFDKDVIGPWQTHPKRFLRHKATIQCARMAFGFVGIFDQDETEKIKEQQARDMGVVQEVAPQNQQQKITLEDARTAYQQLQSKVELRAYRDDLKMTQPLIASQLAREIADYANTKPETLEVIETEFEEVLL